MRFGTINYWALKETFCLAAFTDGTHDASSPITNTVAITSSRSEINICTG